MRRLLPATLIPLFACASQPAPPPAGASDAPAAARPEPADAAGLDDALVRAMGEAQAGVDNGDLQILLRDHWGWQLRESPTFATRQGIHAYDDRISDPSLAAVERRGRERRAFVERAKQLAAGELSPRDAVTAELFIGELEGDIASEVCVFGQWSISPRGNPVTDYNYLPKLHELETPDDGANLIARYKAIPEALDAQLEALDKGAKAGLFANAESTRRVIAMFDDQLAQPLEQWPMYEPAKRELPGWAEAEREAFRTGLRAALEGGVKPAFTRYASFLKNTVAPSARSPKNPGVGALPMGQACYEARIRSFTTLPLTAKEIHEIGLAEIEKIDEEFRVLGKRLFKTRSLKKIFDRLRTDKTLYFDTEQAVEQAATDALAAARAKMPNYFGITPRTDCVVTRIPDYEAPYTTIAYYNQPHADGSKPGEYFINVYAPTTRPRYEAKVLAYHESIPGHHLQIAISQELGELPAFRKHGGYTVFVEGWALYTERLAEEMGLYADDLDRMGMLSFDAWRAGRLVVDTGIHAMGWTRDQAKQFLLEHSALAANNIDNEVDRYIVWPGQALAYKTGQLEIRKLRAQAQEALGDKFSLPAFHDTILGGGAVSIPVLQRRVDAWVKATKGG